MMDSRYDEDAKAEGQTSNTSMRAALIPAITQDDPVVDRLRRQKELGMRPSLMLAMFTSLSFFIYFDRGVYGAVLDDVSDAFVMSDFQAGVCSSAYILCYCVASPVFAQVSKYRPPLRLSVYGMLVWVAAVIFSGLSQGFITLLFARALTGVGEASFLVVAAPFIDKFAASKDRSTWLAIYSSAIPIGYAAGAAVGAEILEIDAFGKDWDWRSVFFLEAICVLPVLLCFVSVRGPPSMLALSSPEDQQRQQQRTDKFGAAVEDLKLLFSNKLYICIVLGYATQTFFVGAIALFGIKYLKEQFGKSEETAGVLFGGITAFCGLIGTTLGGILLDKAKPAAYDLSAYQATSHRQIVICSCLAAPAAIGAFFIESNFTAFVPLLIVGELSSFMTIGPINNSIVWSVPVFLQPTAVACNNLGIHVLGDALSPLIVGALSGEYDLRIGLLVSAFALIFPIFFFSVGLRLSRSFRPVSLSQRTRILPPLGDTGE